MKAGTLHTAAANTSGWTHVSVGKDDGTLRCRPDPGGSAARSTPSHLLSPEPGPVEDVQCQPEATCLALNWTVPARDVGTCLVVAEQLAGGGNAHLMFQANTSRNAVLLPDLVPGTSYGPSLSMPSRNGVGRSPWCSPLLPRPGIFQHSPWPPSWSLGQKWENDPMRHVWQG
uniref:receptor-type tyrosine-protein phosphatase V isoform X2 n=1 Tax=Callithrix jacchus TaxID=9483 RepID=UPI0004F0BFFC|nr:receptor-type tyrosine-protein phosphatase V isoform X2 [Callithrix jacchus]